MFERQLKYLVVFGLIFLYFFRLIQPMMSDFHANRQTLANMKLAASMQPTDRQVVETLSQKLVAGSFEVIGSLLPAFDQNRDHLWGKVDRLRARFPNTWEVHPAPTFAADGRLVRWPFTLHGEGPFAQVVGALAALECEGQIVRVRRLAVSGGEAGRLAIDANLELLFLDSALTRNLTGKGVGQ